MKTDFEDCDAEMTFIDKTPEYKELCETVHQICVKEGGCMGAYDYIIDSDFDSDTKLLYVAILKQIRSFNYEYEIEVLMNKINMI